MAFPRPIIRWTLRLVVLAGIGALAFQVVRCRPRCVLPTTAIDVVHLSSDGLHLLSQGFPGPAQVWNTHDGRIVHELFAEHAIVHLAPSRRGGLAAAVLADDNSLWLVDWIANARWKLEAPEALVHLEFTDSGSLLLACTSGDEPKTFVFDTATKQRKLVAAGTYRHISSDERLMTTGLLPSPALRVIDIETGGSLDLPLSTQDVTFAANGKRLVAGLYAMNIGPLDDPAEPREPLAIYERTDAGYKPTLLKVACNPRRSGVISPDGGMLVTWLMDADFMTKLDFIDATSGRIVASHQAERGQAGGLSPDGTLFSFISHDGGADILMMFDARTGRLLWRLIGVPAACFVPTGGLAAYYPSAITLWDRETIESNVESPSDLRSSMITIGPWQEPPTLHATTDGGHLHIVSVQTRGRAPFFWEAWLDKWLPDLFGEGRRADIVIHAASGRELFRVVGRGEHGAWLSDDGTTLVTAEREGRGDFMLWVWDVHPRRAWMWAIGVAVGSGLVRWSLRRTSALLRRRGQVA